MKYSLGELTKQAQESIHCWYQSWEGRVYVATSGGIDSEVLLYLVRELYPDVVGVFFNTGLEFPEIVAHVKTHENIRIIRPKKNFKWVIDNLGYPVGSKRISKAVAALQNPSDKNKKSRNLYLTGTTSKGISGSRFKIGQKWLPLVDSGIKVSNKCCDVLKKEPALRIEKEGLHPFIGMTKGEGSSRDNILSHQGCNVYDSKRPTSNPLKNWTKNDILQFILLKNIKYCSIYGDIIKTSKGLETTKEKRTGCVFCMFGISFDKYPNRFQRLYITHPKLWEYCMDKLGARKICDLLKIPTKIRKGFGL